MTDMVTTLSGDMSGYKFYHISRYCMEICVLTKEQQWSNNNA